MFSILCEERFSISMMKNIFDLRLSFLKMYLAHQYFIGFEEINLYEI